VIGLTRVAVINRAPEIHVPQCINLRCP